MITLRINGETHSVDVDPATPLLWVIRDYVGLTGTKFACGIAQCGACTVHLDGEPRFSCRTPVSKAVGKKITTIEGLSEKGDHPLQKAWIDLEVAQCGYCQPGQIMRAAGLLEKNPNPSRDEIVNTMSRNLCRCGTYPMIIEAIEQAGGKIEE